MYIKELKYTSYLLRITYFKRNKNAACLIVSTEKSNFFLNVIDLILSVVTRLSAADIGIELHFDH